MFRKEIISRRIYELSNAILEGNLDGFQEFIEICQKTLNNYATTKQKFAQDNHLPFQNFKSFKFKFQKFQISTPFKSNNAKD